MLLDCQVRAAALAAKATLAAVNSGGRSYRGAGAGEISKKARGKNMVWLVNHNKDGKFLSTVHCA